MSKYIKAALLAVVMLAIAFGTSSCWGREHWERVHTRNAREFAKLKSDMMELVSEAGDLMLDVMDILNNYGGERKIANIYAWSEENEFYKDSIRIRKIDGNHDGEPVVKTQLLDSDEKVSVLHLISLRYNGIAVRYVNGYAFDIARNGFTSLHIIHISDSKEVEYYRESAMNPWSNNIFYFDELMDDWYYYVMGGVPG
jgi:hypothetical protein